MVPRINVYVPDDLHEQVEKFKDRINRSEVCQQALRQAVRRERNAEDLMTDMEAVAERLRAQQDEADAVEYDRGREFGIGWAKRAATLADLKRVAAKADADGWELWIDPEHSMHGWLQEDAIFERGHTSIPPDYEFTLGEDDSFSRGIVTGAAEVYARVKDLL